jgi:hypothetical protein
MTSARIIPLSQLTAPDEMRKLKKQLRALLGWLRQIDRNPDSVDS